ncbi:MAG: molybdate ABC transporter substrate-binding protein [Actinomycetota bacterium]
MPRRALGLLTLLLLIPACAGQAAEGGGEPEDSQRGLIVLAAASLTEVFQSLEEPFTVLHPNISPKFSFESSSTLVAQVQQGIQADVIATADEETMGQLESAGLLEEPPQIFALNELAIIVEAGNPRNVQELADLADPNLKVVLAAEEVPAGAYARQSLDAAGVEVQPVSLEEDVKAVVSKVSLGEADAGIVYVTDAKAAGSEVSSVPIPEEHNVVARYPIAVLKDAPNGNHAEDFVELVLSEDGREALTEAGFSLP